MSVVQRMSLARRLFLALFGVFGLSGITGCVDQGFSNLSSELQRRKDGFSIISANHKRAIVAARGKAVAIEPADGFCLAQESLEAAKRSVFVLIGDCFFEEASTTERGSRGELALPRSVPGIITVSISGDSVFLTDRARDATLSEMSEFFDTAPGRAMLGRGASKGTTKVLATRLIGEGLFVQIEDKGDDAFPILSRRFWRAFVELNERLAVVTISGFRDRPLDEQDMLGHLVDQVARLRKANALPITRIDTVIAASPDVKPVATAPTEDLRQTDEVQSIADIKPTSVVITTTAGRQPELWPLPPRKGGEPDNAGAEDQIGKFAPLKAPKAPRRRRSG